MGGFRDKLNRMMYGRYGNDQLNKAILILTIICLVISMFTRIQAFYMIALAGLLLAYYRMLSRNISKRGMENTRYLKATAGLRGKIQKMKNRSADKTHCYFQCPSCHQTVRVPRGKGKISITCPKCRHEFIKRT